VSEQAQRGLRVLKRVRSFFQKFIQIQETFSSELKKAVAYEKRTLPLRFGLARFVTELVLCVLAKIARETDQMHSAWNGWMKFFDKMEQLAAIHSELAQDMTMQVVEPLNQFHEIGLDQVCLSRRCTAVKQMTDAHELNGC
jgi:hypothetical protein